MPTHVRPKRPRIASLSVLLTGLALLGACGGDDGSTEPGVAEDAPITDSPGAGGDAPAGGREARDIPVGDGDGGVRLESIASLDQPLWVTQPPGEDADLYVAQQCGEIVRLPGGDGEPEPFLDLTDQVTCGGEQGLLSLAFAPDYERTGHLYVYFTDLDERQRVVEFTAEDASVDAGSEREVISFDDSYSNHNGGLLTFGPDGLLWIATGDGGGAGDPDRTAQDLSSPLGKLLRIDPAESGDAPYSVPRDNPFAGGEDDALPEIMSFGLRNPWRYSFDAETGDLWIGDVGQSEQEEIDSVTVGEARGANFGWSAFEGTAAYNSDESAPGAIDPVLTYQHSDGGCSVTGGYVVRDAELPSLYGRYLYGDFCSPELRSFSAETGERARDDRALGIEVPGLNSFGTDNSGAIYATSTSGDVFRLTAG
ncbi:hypothetical protein HJD18_04315 [Thermoleophilia bacterium SCSIO 60948]|nr:hypothetical protein HJD18_04315 [Thermoleophilia bacterium SCSIO 60948]